MEHRQGKHNKIYIKKRKLLRKAKSEKFTYSLDIHITSIDE